MKHLNPCGYALSLFFILNFTNAFAQHGIQLDDGQGNTSVLGVSKGSPGIKITFPPATSDQTFITQGSAPGTKAISGVWMHGGNLNGNGSPDLPIPNYGTIGTLDAARISFITGGLSNIRMTILGSGAAAGNVGVGTTTPSALFSVGAGAPSAFTVDNSGLITSTGFTPNTLLLSNAGKNIISVTNGIGALTNNGTGVFTWTANPVGGIGTANTITKWITGSTIGNSALTDDGTNLTYTGVFMALGAKISGLPPNRLIITDPVSNLTTVTNSAGALTNNGIGGFFWTPNPVGGVGSLNAITKWTSGNTIGNSGLTDNGTTLTYGGSVRFSSLGTYSLISTDGSGVLTPFPNGAGVLTNNGFGGLSWKPALALPYFNSGASGNNGLFTILNNGSNPNGFALSGQATAGGAGIFGYSNSSGRAIVAQADGNGDALYAYAGGTGSAIIANNYNGQGYAAEFRNSGGSHDLVNMYSSGGGTGLNVYSNGGNGLIVGNGNSSMAALVVHGQGTYADNAMQVYGNTTIAGSGGFGNDGPDNSSLTVTTGDITFGSHINSATPTAYAGYTTATPQNALCSNATYAPASTGVTDAAGHIAFTVNFDLSIFPFLSGPAPFTAVASISYIRSYSGVNMHPVVVCCLKSNYKGTAVVTYSDNNGFTVEIDGTGLAGDVVEINYIVISDNKN